MTKEEKNYKQLLASLGCMLCRRLYGITDSPVELHHLRTGGWGKGDYKTLISLCVEHHRGNTGIHGLGTKGFEKHYDLKQQDLLDNTIKIALEKDPLCFEHFPEKPKTVGRLKNR